LEAFGRCRRASSGGGDRLREERASMNLSDAAAIDAIYEQQREAAATSPRTTAPERRERLRRLERALLRQAGDVRRALYADFRKPRDEVDVTELNPTIGELRHSHAHVARWMRPVRVPTPLALASASSEVRREPKGHVLILSPWNYPVFLTLAPLAAAVAAGNRAIVRPSEKVPHTAKVLDNIVAAAFDPREVAVVHGDVDVAEWLLARPFDHIFFTGSTPIGKHVMHAAAEHLTSVTLELGGKSPAIVDESADIALAAERIVWGKFINAGQTCVAPDYVLVHERRAEELIRRMRRALKRGFGKPNAVRSAARASVCQLIDQHAYARVADALAATVAAGAQIDAGGACDADDRWIAPTILSRVGPSSAIMQDEIFGPVLPVLTFSDRGEAIRFVNARPRPLALYVFGRSKRAVEAVLSGTTAGGSVVNNTVVHLANPNLPFGGTGASGIGNYHGEFGFRTFSHERAVVLQGGFSLVPLLYPPYGIRTRTVAAFVRRFLS
jgi:aldehyde dehydrogenase (NAD+)